jgi:hypothetical protein
MTVSGLVPSRGRGLLAAAAAVAMTLGSTSAELPVLAGKPVVSDSWNDPSGYAVDCLAVGAAVNAPGQVDGPDLELFSKADEVLGPLTVRRSFDTALPHGHWTSAASGDADAGIRSFVSWKPPHGDVPGTTAGRYDEEIAAWARSVPRTGVFATSFHEPENDMGAAEFVAFQRHVYGVVKSANPTIHWGPVYMAYWWDPATPSHWVGNPKAWWPGDGYADFAAVDWYAPDPRPMTTSPSFRTWYRVMARTGVPLYITEYGQYAVPSGQRSDPAKEQARAAAIREDAAWIADHPKIRMWIYWQATGIQGDWRLRDPAGRKAWREVAASGCPSPAAARVPRAD